MKVIVRKDEDESYAKDEDESYLKDESYKKTEVTRRRKLIKTKVTKRRKLPKDGS